MSQITRLTDRESERQADRILIARPRLHSLQRGKNVNCRHRLMSLPARK